MAKWNMYVRLCEDYSLYAGYMDMLLYRVIHTEHASYIYALTHIYSQFIAELRSLPSDMGWFVAAATPYHPTCVSLARAHRGGTSIMVLWSSLPHFRALTFRHTHYSLDDMTRHKRKRDVANRGGAAAASAVHLTRYNVICHRISAGLRPGPIRTTSHSTYLILSLSV